MIVATTTPDVAMPSTAAILQDRLNLQTIPAFDLNAACSGWLYAVSVAQGHDPLGHGPQRADRGRRHAVAAAGQVGPQRLFPLRRRRRRGDHLVGRARGIASTRRSSAPTRAACTWPAARSRATSSATATATSTRGFGSTATPCSASPPRASPTIIRQAMAKSGWTAEETRWIIPHQANGRILKAAAKRSGVGFERFYLNVEHVGNTSSASIPLAMVEVEESLQPGDKLVLCSVGAGMTTAAISVEW